MTSNIEQKETKIVSVDYEDLIKCIAKVLLRNADNKMTVENLNGIMSSIRQDIERLSS